VVIYAASPRRLLCGDLRNNACGHWGKRDVNLNLLKSGAESIMNAAKARYDNE